MRRSALRLLRPTSSTAYAPARIADVSSAGSAHGAASKLRARRPRSQECRSPEGAGGFSAYSGGKHGGSIARRASLLHFSGIRSQKRALLPGYMMQYFVERQQVYPERNRTTKRIAPHSLSHTRATVLSATLITVPYKITSSHGLLCVTSAPIYT